MVRSIGNQGDDQSAFDWAASISDATQRKISIREAAYQWKEYDLAAAKAAVASANLSSEARNEILMNLEN